MLRIRLRRVGAKKQPSYRIVVADSTAPRDGRFVEVIGFYNPRTEPETVTIKEDRALHWLSVGAQPSNPVVRLFKNNGTLDRLTRLKTGESIEELTEEAQTEAVSRVEILQAETTSEPEQVDNAVVEEEVESDEDDIVDEGDVTESTEEDELESEDDDD